MSNLINKDYIGKKFEASIGEPWDFESSAGDNKLIGHILDLPDDLSKYDWLLLEVLPFLNNNIKINQVLGVNRYISSQNIYENLNNNKKIILNFMFPKDGHNINMDTIFSELEDESNFSFLVGSIKKIW